MAVEWTITIEGKNAFGDVCQRVVSINKSWKRGLSSNGTENLHKDFTARRLDRQFSDRVTA